MSSTMLSLPPRLKVSLLPRASPNIDCCDEAPTDAGGRERRHMPVTSKFRVIPLLTFLRSFVLQCLDTSIEYPPMSEPFVNGLHGSHYSPIHHPQLSRSASHSRQVSPTIPLQRSLSSRAYTNGHYNPYSHPQLEDHPSTAGAALAEPTAPVGLPVYGPYPFQQPPGPYHPTEPERAEVENSLFLGPSRERSDTLVELSQDAEGAKSLLSLATPRENVDMSRMGSRDSGFFTAPTVPEEEGIAAAPLSPRVPHPAAAVEDVYHSSSVLSATSVPVPPRHLSSGSSASGPIPLLVDPGVGRLNGSSINIGDEPKLPPSRYDLLMLEQLVTSIKAQVFELYAKSPKLVSVGRSDALSESRSQRTTRCS